LEHIVFKGGSIYVKPRHKLSTTHFTYIVEDISPAKTHNFRYLCVC